MLPPLTPHTLGHYFRGIMNATSSQVDKERPEGGGGGGQRGAVGGARSKRKNAIRMTGEGVRARWEKTFRDACRQLRAMHRC